MKVIVFKTRNGWDDFLKDGNGNLLLRAVVQNKRIFFKLHHI